MKFVFDIRNESNKEGFLIVGIQLAHPQPQFIMNEHPFVFGERPHIWEKSKKFSIFLYFNKGSIARPGEWKKGGRCPALG